jgi:hypothetical protein
MEAVPYFLIAAAIIGALVWYERTRTPEQRAARKAAQARATINLGEWEYKHDVVHRTRVQRTLNRRGAEGWEPVGAPQPQLNAYVQVTLRRRRPGYAEAVAAQSAEL